MRINTKLLLILLSMYVFGCASSESDLSDSPLSSPLETSLYADETSRDNPSHEESLQEFLLGRIGTESRVKSIRQEVFRPDGTSSVVQQEFEYDDEDNLVKTSTKSNIWNGDMDEKIVHFYYSESGRLLGWNQLLRFGEVIDIDEIETTERLGLGIVDYDEGTILLAHGEIDGTIWNGYYQIEEKISPMWTESYSNDSGKKFGERGMLFADKNIFFYDIPFVSSERGILDVRSIEAGYGLKREVFFSVSSEEFVLTSTRTSSESVNTGVVDTNETTVAQRVFEYRDGGQVEIIRTRYLDGALITNTIITKEQEPSNFQYFCF